MKTEIENLQRRVEHLELENDLRYEESHNLTRLVGIIAEILKEMVKR